MYWYLIEPNENNYLTSATDPGFPCGGANLLFGQNLTKMKKIGPKFYYVDPPLHMSAW